jgi:hypothetical protein
MCHSKNDSQNIKSDQIYVPSLKKDYVFQCYVIRLPSPTRFFTQTNLYGNSTSMFEGFSSEIFSLFITKALKKNIHEDFEIQITSFYRTLSTLTQSRLK